VITISAFLFTATITYAYSVSGHVRDPGGNPVEGARVTLSGLSVNVALGRMSSVSASSEWDREEGGDPGES
jgi:hypothetical protein